MKELRKLEKEEEWKNGALGPRETWTDRYVEEEIVGDDLSVSLCAVFLIIGVVLLNNLICWSTCRPSNSASDVDSYTYDQCDGRFQAIQGSLFLYRTQLKLTMSLVGKR